MRRCLQCKKEFTPKILDGEKFCCVQCATTFLTADIDRPYNEIGQPKNDQSNGELLD